MLNAARWLLRLAGDFCFWKAFHNRHFQQLALRLGQSPDQLLKKMPPFFNLVNISGLWHPGIHFHQPLQAGMGGGSHAALGTLPVHSLCSGLQRQPNPDAAASLNAFCVPPQTGKNLFKDILRGFAVRYDFGDQPKEAGRSKVVELDQRGFVMLCDPVQQFTECRFLSHGSNSQSL